MSLEIDLKVPEQFTVTTGEEPIIQKKRELFFLDVLVLLCYNESAIKAFVERRIQVLGIEGPPGFRPSDDILHLLIVRDSMVASVLERRDDFNRIEASFAHYLTREKIEHLKQDVV